MAADDMPTLAHTPGNNKALLRGCPWLLTPLAVPGTKSQKQKSSLRVYELE
jgi:hypothetical protein